MLLPLPATQPSLPNLVRYSRQLERLQRIAIPFLKLNPLLRRACNVFQDTQALSTSIPSLCAAIRQRHIKNICSHTAQTGIKVVGIVAAVFEYRAAKITKDVFGLVKDIKHFVRAVPNENLEKINELFWTMVISALSLGLTLAKSTELVLALELVNSVVSLNNAVKEVRDENRLLEIGAHLLMACARVYRSAEPLTILSKRHVEAIPSQEVIQSPVGVSMCPVTYKNKTL